MTPLQTPYGYDSYRGRSKTRTFLTVLIVILVVVLLLAIAAFFLLQDHLVYGDDGKAHIDLPFLNETVETPRPSAPAASQPPAAASTPTPEPTPTPKPDVKTLLLAELSVGVLTDSPDVVGRVEEQGGNSAVIDMKTDEGLLTYVSDLPLAIALETSTAQPGLNDAILEGNGTEGLYTVARVSCFKDNTAPRLQNTLAIRTSIGNWRDPTDTRWMSPAVEEVRDYLVGVCVELAELGFDEIWLDNAAYPTVGDRSFITRNERYDPASFTATLDRFYGQVAEALEPYDVVLAISTTPAVLTGEGDDSGQTLELLGKYADRIYVSGPADETASRAYDDALEAMGLSGRALVYTTAPYEPDLSSSYAPLGGQIVTAGNA